MAAAASDSIGRRLSRQYHFARHLRLGQVARRIWLEGQRRLLVAVHRPRALQPSAMEWAPELPRPLFAPRTGRLERTVDGWRFTFLNRAIDFPHRIPWSMPEAGPRDQLWKMNLHYMEYLEEVDDTTFVVLVLDWIDRNRPYARGYWRDSWNSYTLSLRVVVWLQQLAVRRLPTGAVETMKASLVEQLHFLERHLETDIGGNHLIKNIKALIWASACFAGPDAARWRRNGVALLSRELHEQILPDGVHFERSPSYHCQVMADLLECHHALAWNPRAGSTAAHSDSPLSDGIAALRAESAPAGRRRGRQGDQRGVEHLSPRAGQEAGRHQGMSTDWPQPDELPTGGAESAPAGRRRGGQGDRRGVELISMSTDRPRSDEVSGRLARTLQGMAQATADLTHPDGYVALFGDSGLTMAYRPGECLDVFRQLFGRTITPRRHIHLPDAGYYGYRDGGLYLLCDCGPICLDHLPAHGHGDALSFELSIHGHRVIVDPGVLEYNAGPARDSSRTAHSHNTVSIDGMDQGDFYGSFRCGWRTRPQLLEWHELPAGVRLRGSVTLGDSTTVHTRTLSLDATSLSIGDETAPPARRRARASILLHPAVAVERQQDGAIHVRTGGYALRLEGAEDLAMEQALWASDHGHAEPTTALRYAPSTTLTCQIADSGSDLQWEVAPSTRLEPVQ